MEDFWRHPALPIGVVLLVLGLGNWLASRDKVIEYARRAELAVPVERTESLHEFTRLTPRTNATVLDRLHRGFDYGSADAKRDFYMIVQSGGRFITVAGLLSIGLGLLGRWRARRVRRAISRDRLREGHAAPERA
jgi:hypothetical protein